MNRTRIVALLFALTLLSGLPVSVMRAEEPASPRLTIALTGDSTVCDCPAHSDRRGRGRMLPELLAPSVTVLNEAREAGAESVGGRLISRPGAAGPSPSCEPSIPA